MAYRALRPVLAPFSPESRLAFYLRLEWIFCRLAHEESFRCYKNDRHPLLINSVAWLRERLSSGQYILDLGCGHGAITHLLAEAGHEVVGVDHTPAYIEAAKRNYSGQGIRFECQDGRAFLEQNTRKFDVLVLSHVLEHLDDPVACLKSYIGFFRFVFIEVPDFDCSYLNHYRVVLRSRLLYTDVDHLIEFDRDELLKTVQEAGLKVLDQETRFGIIRLWCSTDT